MNKIPRIFLGIACAFVVALIGEALGFQAPWVGFASALFIWTILTERLAATRWPRRAPGA